MMACAFDALDHNDGVFAVVVGTFLVLTAFADRFARRSR
jgi:hypothetical protein